MDGAPIASAEEPRRSPAPCRRTRTGARRPDLRRQGEPAARSAQSADPAGGVSEPGVLPGPGDAAADLRQAARSSRVPRTMPATSALPRGCLEEVRDASGRPGDPSPSCATNASAGGRLPVTFQGELRPEQRAAAKAMLAHDTGVLSATTAFGKTVIAAWLIAQRGVNTLVLVHRQQLAGTVGRAAVHVPGTVPPEPSDESAAGARSSPAHWMWR